MNSENRSWSRITSSNADSVEPNFEILGCVRVSFPRREVRERENRQGSGVIKKLDLKKQFDEGDTTNYQTNGEFDLVSFEAIRNVQTYSCCVEPYPDITYVIKLRRRPMFYVFNLILPCLLINGIALLVFYVPSESGEKVTLGINALLSMTVFLMTIRDTLPPTEKTPLISTIIFII
ncbi:Neuronal acetylcholine receptor subunit alpha-10 [Eumeta japonica]|uniref:Neuronal acetylcholine receptor subunit alpha-10 n=1 Tax=Eumeta variegata TaxID=151549 RepID=A0A4C1SQ93_EUMVA|nr:Neuronal acetylcholine receptor subunit alpha-10 [Eumeta japonica]